MKKKLYLVDISSYVFRAYFGIRALKTSAGVSTNATYGVITMLHKLIREKKPDHLAIIYDSPTPTVRKEFYPEYKATRQVVPEDLPAQFGHIHRFVEAYPLPYLERPGYEADDIIATLIQKYRKDEKNNLEVVIVSADKDLMQLIGPGVTMFDSMKDKIIAEPEVLEKFGVAPHQVGDVLALMGDASDNIPGVKGIGGKTASKLIAQWGNLDKLLAHASEVPGKIGEALKTHAADALLSKKLVTLYSDLKVDCGWDFFELKEANEEELQKLYREYELKTLIRGSPEGVGAIHELPLPRANYELILEEKDLARWAKRLQNAKNGFAFDTETTGLDTFRARLVGVSFSDAPSEGCYIPVSHSYLGCPEQISKEKILAAIRGPLEDPAISKWAQNGKFDMEILSCEGICVQGLKGDSMIASYLLNPEGIHNLDHLAKEHLQHQTMTFDEVVGKGMTFEQVEVEKACAYSSEDADMAFRLIPILHEALKKDGLKDCYEKIEMPLVDVLFRVESNGVLVDVSYLGEMAVEFAARMGELEKKIYESAGCDFNVQSPRQLAEILFTKLKLPPQRKIKTGFSTDVDVLTTLSKLHPMPGFLLQHRLIAKLKSTYVDQLRNLVHPNGRIHTSYNQTIAATGRLSSSDPNLQNIPIRTEEGRRIRKAFIAPPGCKILSADYSQIELRLLAAFSKDPHLVEAFKKGEDVHRMTAQKIFGTSTDSQRSMAKTVNFGIMYGQSPFGLAAQLEIPQGDAKKFIDGFYAQYPAVRVYKEEALVKIRKTGEVRTWQGRRRLVPEINSANNNLKTNAERFAFNMIFQGSAADLIKVAMIKIDEKLQKYKTRMIMQVHDELVFEVPEKEIEAVSKLVTEEMENAIPCEVPLKVDIGVGENWDEAH